MTRGVLFVSHEASRSGAPIALLHFLRWFKKNSSRPFSVLLPTRGELTSSFAEVTETWAIDQSHWCPGGRRASVMNGAGLGSWVRRAELSDIHAFVAGCSPGLVYINSIWKPEGTAIGLSLGLPVLTHVHELEIAFRLAGGPSLNNLLSKTHHFIACSNSVRENLIRKPGIGPKKVDTVHESIPIDQCVPERPREHVLEELKVPSSAHLVVGAGQPCWRKGADLFIQLVRSVCQTRSDVYFAWIGGSSHEVAMLEHDARLLGIADKLRLTGAVLKATDYFQASDVFVLTSREDPYPLVCLEAAAAAKPIVCFAGAGGMPEFVEEDCGFIVPYLDLEAMVEKVIFLLDCQDSRRKMGAAARSKVARRHDINVAGPNIAEIIERVGLFSQ